MSFKVILMEGFFFGNIFFLKCAFYYKLTIWGLYKSIIHIGIRVCYVINLKKSDIAICCFRIKWCMSLLE